MPKYLKREDGKVILNVKSNASYENFSKGLEGRVYQKAETGKNPEEMKLYSEDGPKYEDVFQKNPGICFFMGVLASMAAQTPQIIKNMITQEFDENKKPTGYATVHFFAKDGANKVPYDVRVPLAHSKMEEYPEGKTEPRWVTVIQKAYFMSMLWRTGGKLPTEEQMKSFCGDGNEPKPSKEMADSLYKGNSFESFTSCLMQGQPEEDKSTATYEELMEQENMDAAADILLKRSRGRKKNEIVILTQPNHVVGVTELKKGNIAYFDQFESRNKTDSIKYKDLLNGEKLKNGDVVSGLSIINMNDGSMQNIPLTNFEKNLKANDDFIDKGDQIDAVINAYKRSIKLEDLYGTRFIEAWKKIDGTLKRDMTAGITFYDGQRLRGFNKDLAVNEKKWIEIIDNNFKNKIRDKGEKFWEKEVKNPDGSFTYVPMEPEDINMVKNFLKHGMDAVNALSEKTHSFDAVESEGGRLLPCIEINGRITRIPSIANDEKTNVFDDDVVAKNEKDIIKELVDLLKNKYSFWHNSGKYKNIIAALDLACQNINKPYMGETEITDKAYVASLCAVKNCIVEYYEHKAEKGVKENAQPKLAALEQVNKFVNARLYDIGKSAPASYNGKNFINPVVYDRGSADNRRALMESFNNDFTLSVGSADIHNEICTKCDDASRDIARGFAKIKNIAKTMNIKQDKSVADYDYAKPQEILDEAAIYDMV